MRIPLTKYGLPQVVVFPATILAAMVSCFIVGALYLSTWAVIVTEALLAVALIWTLSFFRDPHRLSPPDSEILLAPADGKITDIEIVEKDDFISGTALRIGIFLRIFDAHINRAPCNVKVERVTYRPGRYKNAISPESRRVNESNDLEMTRTDSPQDKLIVRQISGAIARRIVCTARQGQELTGGQKFGMIKFGSRTELYMPARENAECLVRVGDKVKAGVTPIVKYEIRSTGFVNRDTDNSKCPD
jgi:phosphatidylserine decarboxylase